MQTEPRSFEPLRERGGQEGVILGASTPLSDLPPSPEIGGRSAKALVLGIPVVAASIALVPDSGLISQTKDGLQSTANNLDGSTPAHAASSTRRIKRHITSKEQCDFDALSLMSPIAQNSKMLRVRGRTILKHDSSVRTGMPLHPYQILGRGRGEKHSRKYAHTITKYSAGLVPINLPKYAIKVKGRRTILIDVRRPVSPVPLAPKQPAVQNTVLNFRKTHNRKNKRPSHYKITHRLVVPGGQIFKTKAGYDKSCPLPDADSTYVFASGKTVIKNRDTNSGENPVR